MKSALLLVAFLIAGCAIVEDERPTDERRFTAVTTEELSNTTQHGLITVKQVSPRSDIAVLPPSVQHVVWLPAEYGLEQTVGGSRQRPIEPRETEIVRRVTRPVRDNWPLLEKDLDFASEIGRVEMCDSVSGPWPLEPCAGPDDYDCFMTKPGEYCLEKLR